MSATQDLFLLDLEWTFSCTKVEQSALGRLNYIVSSLKISMSLPQDLFLLNLKCAFSFVKVQQSLPWAI